MKLGTMDKLTKDLVKRAIRTAFKRSEIYETFVDSSVSKTDKGSRGGKRWHCNSCKLPFAIKDLEVDHIIPVVPVTKKENDMEVEDYYIRVNCVDNNNKKQINLQLLCKRCHKEKSKMENKRRRENNSK